MPPRFIEVYCIVCLPALSPIQHCVHCHPTETIPHFVCSCVCACVFYFIFVHLALQSQEMPELCYFMLLFFNTMTVKFDTIQSFNKQI